MKLCFKMHKRYSFVNDFGNRRVNWTKPLVYFMNTEKQTFVYTTLSTQKDTNTALFANVQTD